MTKYSPYHYVYDMNGDLIVTFTSAVWYDTATPAQWCIRRLNEIDVRLEREVVKIESDGDWHVIKDRTQFLQWIDDVFCVDTHTSFSGAIGKTLP